jgi:histidine triad (HIT) family protein
MSADCLFCRIVRREIPATIVHEDEHCVAFRDIGPQAPTHILVIPRQHVSTAAAEIARAEKLVEAGYRTVINTNAGSGQTVFHLHVHVLGGRRMTWPPG